MYKKSQYNLNISNAEGNYLRNTKSGALARVSSDIFQAFREEDCEQSPYFDMLKQNGFLVPKELNEYELVRERAIHHMSQKDSADLFYVIAPTLACNYACTYCFESNRTSHRSMTPEVVLLVKKYIAHQIQTRRNLKTLHITWFGGEPLLQMKIIEDISEFLICECRKKGVNYRASIITNGRFLVPECVKKLYLLNVRKVQISMDGTCSTYCQRKKATLHDYETTIQNIVNAANMQKIKILIRINIKNNDFSEANALTNFLLREKKLDGKVKIYTACVNEGTSAEKIQRFKAYVELEHEFAQQFGSAYQYQSFYHRKPIPKGVPCSMSCSGNFCIGPDGELYKCEHHFGNEKFIVGTIQSGFLSKKMEDYQQASLETISKTECQNCVVFPSCMGGCPNGTLTNERNFDCDKLRLQFTERMLSGIRSIS